MIAQDLHARFGCLADPAENFPSARGSPDLAHQPDGVGTRRSLLLARIGGLQHAPCRDDHRAATDEVAEQHAEQEQQASLLQHSARAVAMHDVADLVRQNAGKLSGVAAASIRPSTRQREGVALLPMHRGDGKRKIERRRG